MRYLHVNYAGELRSDQAPYQHTTRAVSPFARPEDLHRMARHAPFEKRALAHTHFDHIIPAVRMFQAECGEGKVSFVRGPGLREIRQIYVVAHYALSIDHFAARP